MKSICNAARRAVISVKALPLLLLLFFCFCARAEDGIVFSEVMAKNGTYKNGHAYDWLEVYNGGKQTADLGGYWLSNDPDDPFIWQIPQGTKLKKGAFLLVYCTGDKSIAPGGGSVLYAPFKISAKGVTLTLSDRDGQAVTSLYVPRQYADISWGRVRGGSEYRYLSAQTPGKQNTGSGAERVTDEPSLSSAGGHYSEAVTVQVSGKPGDTLRYTTDGSLPTEKSKIFPADGLKISKTSVLRVRAFAKDAVAGQAAAATYLIREEHTVPSVCLISDEKYLFDSKTGALVKGTGSTPNYEKELEYPVHIEYFDTDGRCLISQTGTFTAAGHSARQNTQKSIAIYARGVFGKDTFDFDPFPHRDHSSYKSLLLRSTNSDAFSTRLRDAVYSSLAEKLDIAVQDALAVEVYINGRYWGHYNLREKINKYFVAQRENVTDPEDIENIDILARTGSDSFVQHGSNEDWLNLCDFCKTKDLNDPENLAFVEERLDIDSLFTHAAFEIIIGNGDFTNVRVYRVPGGKWKYLLFDTEAGFNNDEWNVSPLEYYIKPVSGKIQGFRHEPLNALLNVPEMKARFLERYAGILELCFLKPVLDETFSGWEETVGRLLPRHIARWKNLTVKKWQQNVSAVKNHARRRPAVSVILLGRAMKLSDSELEQYFGEIMKKLVDTNFSEKEKKSFFGSVNRWWE